MEDKKLIEHLLMYIDINFKVTKENEEDLKPSSPSSFWDAGYRAALENLQKKINELKGA